MCAPQKRIADRRLGTTLPAMKEFVLKGGTVVTMNAAGEVHDKADVHIKDGRIEAIGKVRARGVPTIDCRGAAIVPGLVQSHVHLCQTLFRGMADDLALLPWLKTRIWPLEAAHDRSSLRASARLGATEMLRCGTTTILDMGTVHHQDVIFEVLEQSGLRAYSGKAMMDQGEGIPEGLQETTAESLSESARLCKKWNGAADGRLGYAYAPRFILSCSQELLEGVSADAREFGAKIHSHVAEHADEREAVKTILGEDDVANLARRGLSGPDVILAHGVQVRKGEMKAMAKAGTRIVHCPSANLKLASGIADIKGLRDAGVVVGIGADGAPCNNRMDPWIELREAALLAKVRRKDAAALLAKDVFELATIAGAKVLGLDDEIGSLEVGKKADITVVGIDGLHQGPAGDVYGQLVYATDGRDVRWVFVDGKPLVEDGEVKSLDPKKVLQGARREAKKVATRAGLA